jgi:hypothetical protein
VFNCGDQAAALRALALSAIAILIAGSVDARMLSRRLWLTRLTMWWFVLPVLAGIAGIVALFVIGRRSGCSIGR